MLQELAASLRREAGRMRELSRFERSPILPLLNSGSDSWSRCLPFSLLMLDSGSILPVVIRSGMVCVAVLVLFACQALAFEWTLVRHDGRDYVPIEEVAKFYSFTQASYSGDNINLEGATLRMLGGVNSRELYLNGLKFILSFPIIKVDDRILMSRMDLSKLVEPVLRPTRIAAKPVHTVVLDAGHGGFDQGAQSILGSEKDFALDVVKRARELLLRAGFNVRLTTVLRCICPTGRSGSICKPAIKRGFCECAF